jgi:hypothetical protein
LGLCTTDSGSRSLSLRQNPCISAGNALLHRSKAKCVLMPAELMHTSHTSFADVLVIEFSLVLGTSGDAMLQDTVDTFKISRAICAPGRPRKGRGTERGVRASGVASSTGEMRRKHDTTS